ncbi:hypothetical protein ACLRGF_04475 [Mycetocola zhadangensis]|uniref:hypothetical protein n=1 Tax=Mycetocola zhadangensis TaxID=1164595 RepID=UPI003A4E61C3
MSPSPDRSGTTDTRRVRVALITAGALLVVLAVGALLVDMLTPFAGADATGWLPAAMIVASVAGYLAVLLRSGEASALLVSLLLPMLGAVAAFLLAGGVLIGLGGGDPLRGPVFALGQFGAPGVYLVAVLSVLAALAFRMGTYPHRDRGSRSVG